MDSTIRLVARVGLILLLTTILMVDGLPQQPVSAQQETPSSPITGAPPTHLAFDGMLDMPRLPSGAGAGEAALASAEPQYAAWSRLAFQSARNDHDWEVYGALGDGSDQVNLSNDDSMDIHPRLIRGATLVAFASNREGNYDIFRMNADGSGQTRLTGNEADDVYPAWSPDGSRIVFQSYRDDQAEIYVMNADGAGSTRLTHHDDYDGMPAWSPDGSRIAFTRRESDLYRIWVMNADGSNPQQLSSQPYSENPAWSPDGSQIAYDADGNGDGWQEIWLMDMAGGNQRMVYSLAGSNSDTLVRSWSPDGRYIAFTQVNYTQYQGQWYWTMAFLEAWDSANPGSTIVLAGLEEWYPDWQTTDIQAPASSIEPLPAQSPATFTVTWGGTDIGESGIRSYDVQVKDGPGGAWMDWQMGVTVNQASYTGVGGHTYYFRVRARDNAYNLESWPADYDACTTVEAMPPVTAVQSLSPFTRGEDLLIQWGGSDPGGSGIESYDVQVREGSGAWTDWLTGTTDTWASFNGSIGKQYGFRARARDKAQNLETYPAGGDTTTVLYSWAVSGHATDNRGAPVMGIDVTTAPAAFLSGSSGADGAYAAYVAAQAADYTVDWSKAAYGALPATEFPAELDAEENIVLPPADNIVGNWGFEDGDSAWQFGGSRTATITTSVKHSGVSAGVLGSGADPLRSITTLPDPPAEGGRHPLQDSGMDATDVIHSIWIGPGQHIMYSSKSPGEPWAVPAPLPGPTTSWGPLPGFAVDNSGTAHAVWVGYAQYGAGLYYAQKQTGAEWSIPEVIPTVQVSSALSRPSIAMGTSAVVKVAWEDGSVYYGQRDPSGNWTSPVNISSPYQCSGQIKMVTDPAGLAQVLWIGVDGATGHASAFYTAETDAGSWLPAVKLSQHESDVRSADMVIDARGAVHVVTAAEGVHYRSRPSGGPWSPTEVVATSTSSGASLAVDDLDRIHVAWNDTASNQVLYASRANGAWTDPVAVTPPTVTSVWLAPSIAVGGNLSVHVLWLDSHSHGSNSFYGVGYSARDAQGRWSPLVDVTHSTLLARDLQLLVERSGTPHALWSAPLEGNWWPVFYAGPGMAQSTGEATLSQSVEVPVAALAPTLSFLHRSGAEFPSDSSFEVVVDDGISASTVFSATTGTDAWQHEWADLTPWAERTVTLRFKVSEATGGARAWAYIDEVTVGSAHPDIWVGLGGPRSAAPGQQFVQAISYGNRGGVGAGNAQVTLQLPAELAFVSAGPPPSSTAPELRWDLGDLAGQSGPETIHVTLQVASDATPGTTLTTTAGIASGTAEIEQENNAAQAQTFVGYLRYLPVVDRQ